MINSAIGAAATRGGCLMVSALMVAACATNPPPKAPSLSTVRVKVPSFSPLAETKELQERGGIEISAAPVPYEVAKSSRVVDQLISPSFSERLLRPSSMTRFVERSTIPTLQVNPTHLRFRINVTNKLPRVFRGAGTVVQFQVQGKAQQVDQRGYQSFLDAIIPPRQQQQIEVEGPSLDSLSEQGVIGLFLYDVVTKTDTAGNITEKHNFEWFFNYGTNIREEAVEIHKERLWLP